MASLIGVVSKVVGQVFAVGPGGNRRLLVEGDRVYAGETLDTGVGGAVAVHLQNGSELTLGRGSSLELTPQLLAGEAPVLQVQDSDPSNTQLTDVERLQQAIAAGDDPTLNAEPTAAGPNSPAATLNGPAGSLGGGHSFVLLEAVGGSVAPVIGFPTEGLVVNPEFPQPVVGDLNVNQAAPGTTTPPVTPPVDNPVIIGDLDNNGPEHIVYEANLSNGTDPNADALTKRGSFTVDAKDGLASLTIDGVQVIANNTLVGTSIVGQDGNTLTITGYDASTQTISYSYTLSQAQTNTGKAGEALYEDFKVVATDPQGDSDTAWLNVQIVDDAPIAGDDTSTVATESNPTVTGNVLDNDKVGADSNATPVTAQTLVGEYGTLTLNSDGSYSYALKPGTVLPNGFSGTDVFQYTLTDGDGDSTTAKLTVPVGGVDHGITIVGLDNKGPEQTVYEANLRNGTDPNADALTVKGTFNIDAKDGLSSLTIDGVQIITNDKLVGTSVVGQDGNTLTITGYDASTQTLSYSYTLSEAQANLGKADQALYEDFKVVATDPQGQSDLAWLNVQIVDDAPIATDDTSTVATENNPTVTGNVLDNDKVGADSNATPVTAQTLVGEYGTLTLNSDGSYSYALKPGTVLPNGFSGTDVFQYTLTDGDGDSTTAKLTVPVGGVDHGITIVGLDNKGPEQTVYEANLSNGTDPNADALTVKGTFNIDAKDGLSSLTIDGVQIISNNALVGTSVVGQDGNTLTITGYDASTQTLSYSYTLSEAQANLGKADQALYEDFKVVATDPQGQSDLAWLNVQIVDDAPIATDDTSTVATENNPTVTGNVLDNDKVGADSNATPVTAQTLVGEYGTLTLNSDGSYSYALKPGTVLPNGFSGTDVFQYTLTDGDGDSTTAKLTVPVGGVDHGITIVGLDNKGPEQTVYEANLSNGTDPNADALTVKGTFNIDAKDGLSSLTIDGVQIITNDTLVGTSVVGQDGNTLTITGYDASTQTLSYSYTLSEAQANLGKADQALYEDFKVVATDPQGQSDFAWLNVKIVDDAPVAKPDFATASDHQTSISGNVLANDLIGADTNERPVTAQTNVKGTYGTLNLNSDGTYTYTVNTDSDAYKAIIPGQHADEHFQYQITDGDGDTATSWLNIQVNNIIDPITLNIAQDTLTVQESALPGGTHENTDGQTVDSTFKVEAADGVQNLTVGGVEVVKNGQVMIDQDGASAKTDYGTFTVTGYSEGTVYYKYTLEKAASHEAGQGANTIDDNIAIVAQSRGGESTSGQLHMRIVDDVPSASQETPTLDVQNGGTNLMLVLDTSNSMNGDSKVDNLSRLEFAKQAIDTLIGQYQDLGDVRVQIVTFNTYANQLESHWMTADQAREVLKDITASGGTNYDYALDKASEAWSAPGALENGQNVSYFLSDGNPTLSDQQPLPVKGVQSGRETEPGVGDGIDAKEALAWEGFLRDHNIKSYAIGMGPSLDTKYLDPIAYDGVLGQDTDAQWARNLSDLPEALAGTVTSAPVSGSLVGDGGFGADGGHVSSLSVDGVTWTYVPASGRELGSVQASDPNAKYSFNPASGELTISTEHSGELSVNLNTGAYQYALKNGNSGGYRENITFTLEDNDRDTASSSLVVTVKAAAEGDFTASNVNRLRVLDDARTIERSDFHANTAILLATVLVAGTLGTPENGRLSDALTVTLRKGETLDVSQLDGKQAVLSWAGSDGVYHTLGKDGFTADHDGQYHIKVSASPVAAAQAQDSDYSLQLGLHYGQQQVETRALEVDHAQVQSVEHATHARVAVAQAAEHAEAANAQAKAGSETAQHHDLTTLLGDEHEQPLLTSDQAGQGHDVLVAGSGNEVLSGGTGANTFTWEPGSSGHDVVTDFKPGVDTLDLSQLLGDVAKNGSLDDFFKVTQQGKGDDVSTTLIVGKGSNAQSIELEHVNLAEQYHATTQANGSNGVVVSAHDVISGLLGDHSLKVEMS